MLQEKLPLQRLKCFSMDSYLEIGAVVFLPLLFFAHIKSRLLLNRRLVIRSRHLRCNLVVITQYLWTSCFIELMTRDHIGSDTWISWLLIKEYLVELQVTSYGQLLDRQLTLAIRAWVVHRVKLYSVEAFPRLQGGPGYFYRIVVGYFYQDIFSCGALIDDFGFRYSCRCH